MTGRPDHLPPSPNERLVHGLLGLIAVDHAARQDRRIRLAMAHLARHESVIARIGRFGRFGVARVAAAGALAATLAIAVVLSIGPAANSAHAMLQSISNRLATGNRSYRQTIVLGNRDGTESLREASVDVGTGRRFVFAIDLDSLPLGPRGAGAPGDRMNPMPGPTDLRGERGPPEPPGMRGRRGPEGPDRVGPDGPAHRGPDGPEPHERRGAPPIAWGFDGNEHWQIDLSGAVTRSIDPQRMRDPIAFMGGPVGDQDNGDEDAELLTLQPLLDRLQSGFDLAVVVGSQSLTADGSPLVVIDATLRPDALMSVRQPMPPRDAEEHDGPSIRKGRRGMHPPPIPSRVRLVADAQTNELVSVIADWPDGSRFLRRIVVERVAPRATDDGWFSPERHLPAATPPQDG